MENLNEPANPSRSLALMAVLSGVGMLLAALAILLAQPTTLPWMPAGFLTPMLALGFATDLGSVRQMLGDDGIAAHALIQAIHWNMVFVACYAAFLVSVVCALFKKGIFRYIALFFAIIAPIAAVAENLQLLTLLEFVVSGTSLKAEPPIDFSHLRLAAVVKFGAIAIVHIRLLRLAVQLGRYGRILAGFLLASVFATGASFYTLPFALDAAVVLVSVSWCLLWAMMLIQLRNTATPQPG